MDGYTVILWLIFARCFSLSLHWTFPTAFRYCEPSTERGVSTFPPNCVRVDYRSGRNPGADETVLGRESRPEARLPRNQEDYKQDFNQQRNVCALSPAYSLVTNQSISLFILEKN